MVLLVKLSLIKTFLVRSCEEWQVVKKKSTRHCRALTKRWSFDRLEIILRAILRAGVYELTARMDTPARVVITEYVDVAHAFYNDREPGLVNGMLDRIAHTFRPGEFGDGSRGD